MEIHLKFFWEQNQDYWEIKINFEEKKLEKICLKLKWDCLVVFLETVWS